MGTVLEMRRGAIIGAALALAGLVAGCGPEAQNPLTRLVGSLVGQGQDTAAPGQSAATVDPSRVLTAEYIASGSGPLLLATLPSRDGYATLSPVGRNGAVETWRSADGIGLSLTPPGLLVATRGLGPDLMLAETGAVVAALRAGEGDIRRVHRLLDGENHEDARAYDCRVVTETDEMIFLPGEQTRQTVRLREHCVPAAGQEDRKPFDNFYWTSFSGDVIWQSYQWLGPELGTIFLQRLR